MDQTAESHEPALIAGKRNDEVLVSVEDGQAIEETLHLRAGSRPVSWAVVFAQNGQKDAQKLAASGLKGQAQTAGLARQPVSEPAALREADGRSGWR